MRYIIDSNGCIKELSFGAIITCGGTECTEYTGSIPTGYESLESWYLVECETLYRWKIVDGELTLDETATAPVETVIVRMNSNENPYIDVMHGDSTGCHHIEPYYSSDGSSGFIVYNDGVAYILSMASTGLNLRYYDQSSGQFIDYTLDGSGGSSGGGTGEAGVGILSVTQTTTSTEDGGNNVITVTLTDGTKSTFTVKNGSKGSTGETGPQGEPGKSAYAYAQDGGYTGTEEEFAAKLNSVTSTGSIMAKIADDGSLVLSSE